MFLKAEKSNVGNTSKSGNNEQGVVPEEVRRSRIKNRWKEVGENGQAGSSSWTSPKVFTTTSLL